MKCLKSKTRFLSVHWSEGGEMLIWIILTNKSSTDYSRRAHETSGDSSLHTLTSRAIYVRNTHFSSFVGTDRKNHCTPRKMMVIKTTEPFSKSECNLDNVSFPPPMTVFVVCDTSYLWANQKGLTNFPHVDTGGALQTQSPMQAESLLDVLYKVLSSPTPSPDITCRCGYRGSLSYKS